MTTLARPQRTIQPLVAGARGYRKHLGQYGAGGRSSVNDKSVAVFGATGFLGRFVTNRLGEFGANLLSAGSLDDPDDEDSMRAAIGDADTVVNLIGKYYETKHICFTRKEDGSISRINSSFKNVNVDVPARLARAAKAAGVKNFVHVSALAQDPESPSMWAKTKAEGEVAVKAEFPEATIIRPAKLFGSDDRLLMWLSFLASKMGNIPLVNNGSHLIQPIDARNVAEVIMTVVDDPENVDYRGKVIELAGPGEFSWSETVDFVLDSTHLGPMTTLRDMDLEQAKMWGMLLEQLPDPMWTVDEAVQMTTDVVTKPNPDALTLDDFGVKPYKMEEAGIHLLMRFKRVQHFGLVKGYH